MAEPPLLAAEAEACPPGIYYRAAPARCRRGKNTEPAWISLPGRPCSPPSSKKYRTRLELVAAIVERHRARPELEAELLPRAAVVEKPRARPELAAAIGVLGGT
jgi:hypothetical protein